MIERVQTIFREVFNNQQLTIHPDILTNEIKMWDSLTHLELIAAIEKEFDLKFTFNEVMRCNSVKEIIALIGQKKV